MRIFGRTLTLAAVAAVAFASLAMAAKINEAKVSLGLGQKATSKSTSLDLSVKVSSKGQEHNPGQLEITLPKGATISNDAADTCGSSTTSYDDCPNGSRIGSGSAAFGGADPYSLHLTNGDGEFTIWYEFSPGSYFPLAAEIDGRKVTAPYFALESLKLKLDETTDGQDALIRTPSKCPKSKKWTSTVKITYYNDSGEGDDVVETDKPKTGCKG